MLKSKSWKRVLCMVLTVCIMFGMVPHTGRMSLAAGNGERASGMIYLEGTSEKIYQTVRLEKGKTYTFSYLYDFLEGGIFYGDSDADSVIIKVTTTMDATSWKEYYLTNGSGEQAFQNAALEGELRGNRHTFTWQAETGEYNIGFYLIGRSTKAYLGDIRLYTEDKPETNLLPNKTDYPGDLYGWRNDWGRPNQGDVTYKDGNNYTATLMSYDERHFMKETVQGMIYLEGTSEKMYQTVRLEKGKTYTFSYLYNFEEGGIFYGDSDTDSLQVKITSTMDASSWNEYFATNGTGEKAFLNEAQEGGLQGNRHIFTWQAETGDYNIGFYLIGRSTKAYLADVKLYAEDDPETNLLPNKMLYPGDLYGWCNDWGWPNQGDAVYKDGNNYTATLMKYDENLFKKPEPARQGMLWLKGTSEKLYQTVRLEQGKTYTFSYLYYFEEGGIFYGDSDTDSLQVKITSTMDASPWNEYFATNGTGEKAFLNEAQEGGLQGNRHTFTWQAETGDYNIGFYLIGRSTEVYLADIKLYTQEDPETNLLPNKTVIPGDLYGWRNDWGWPQEGESAYRDGENYVVCLMDYMENFFEIIESEGLGMIYLEGFREKIYQQVKLEQGKTYTFSYLYDFEEGGIFYGDSNTDSLMVKVTTTADAPSWKEYYLTNGSGEQAFRNEEMEGELQGNRHSFTWNDATGTYNIGFYLIGRSTKVYLAGMRLYASDKPEENLLKNQTVYPGDLYGWRNDWSGPQKGYATFSDTDAQTGEWNYTATLQKYNENRFKKTMPKGPGMLYLDGTSEKLYQTVQLEHGKTYAFSYLCNFVEGGIFYGDSDTDSVIIKVTTTMDAPSWKEYYLTNGSGEQAFRNAEMEGELQGNRHTFTWNGETGSYNIGFYLIGRSTKVYLADIQLYDTDNSAVNLLRNKTVYPGDLYGWRNDWAAPQKGDSVYEDKDGNTGELRYTVTLMKYDESQFKTNQVEAGPGMIYLDGNGEKLYQTVQLEHGKTYVFSYLASWVKGGIFYGDSYSDSVIIKVTTTMDVPVWKEYYLTNGNGEQAFLNEELKGELEGNRHTFTWKGETGSYNIGFYMFDRETKVYLADIRLYDTDKPETNLLKNKTLYPGDLYGWRNDWARPQKGDTVYKDIDGNTGVLKYTATLMKYEENRFKRPEPAGPSMIYVDCTDVANYPVFGQNVRLEKGESYTISYKCKIVEGELDTTTYLRVKSAIGIGEYETYKGSNESGDKALPVKMDKASCTATAVFDWNQESGTYGFCFQFVGLTKMYLSDVTLYKTNDASKENLLPSAGREDTLYGWKADWSSAERGSTEFVTNDYKAVVKPYDAGIFVPDPEKAPRMLYVENNGAYRQLIQRVKLEVGKTYRFSFGIASTAALRGMVMHKGEREIVFNDMSPINEPAYDQDYYEAVFEFTLPATVGGKPLDNEIFVGIQFPASTTAYIFNPKLWEVGDPEKTNIYVNPGFNKGMDNWALSWGAWFIPGCEGTGVNEYEVPGEFKLQVMDYDEAKFITYYDDSRIDDGKWWADEDVLASEKKGNGTIKGSFTEKDKKPIADAKMELVSKKETYTCKTDEEGLFVFEKLPADYYELYVIGDGGERLAAGFASNLQAGYTINLAVTRDGTKLSTEVVEDSKLWIWFVAGGGILIVAAAGAIVFIRMRKKKTASTTNE